MIRALPAAMLALSVSACSCSRPESARAIPASAGASPPSLPSVPLSPSAPTAVTAMPTTPPAGVGDASLALDTSTMERLVFRQILVGGYTFNWQRTWILHRSAKRARLDVLCQNGVEHLRLTGKENDDSAWKEPVLMRYAGTREDEGTYRLALSAGTPGRFECAWMPQTIVLACRAESIAVLRVSAQLILEDASAGAFHWAPSASERVSGLRCGGVTNERFEWPLVFVAPKSSAPGVEWAFQHDDAVQQGAHRWMPAPR